MFTGQGKVVIGYKWVTFGGSKACKACREMNGREFYFNPGPGQESTTHMPEPPLHPNCGCKLQEIIDVARAASQPEDWDKDDGSAGGEALPQEEEPAETGQREDPELFKDRYVGLTWRRGRILNGPVHGNFCGEYWTHGQDTRDKNYTKDNSIKPTNDMDAACRIHDTEYVGDNKDQANRKLVAALQALPEDPNKWENKPPSRKIEEARKYRKWALWYFENEIARVEQEARDRYEWGYDAEGGRP
ncbi:MAG: hypothetical protein K9K66_10060 [Desulfarculaceae bacterium]|nr:hypothetical protein [Desulfarculaceae bacterium]MCF8073751.1 hypothetical protein [Desulfarculaceae bacterium]MCF8101992.1 hypothetical protein [Desulfarculaceae bacterium]MCF8115962.1 hypothetical protein [Desulfarculaceae bacterium]